MREYTLVLILGCLTLGVFAPPPRRQEAQAAAAASTPDTRHAQQQQAAEDEKPLYQFAYSKYLEAVIKILESDEKFRSRIKEMKEEDIKAGTIADHIDDLDPKVFEELTKAKLKELERLREQIEADIKQSGDATKVAIPEHIDVMNWEKFHKEDLRMLIKKTVTHMDEIDAKRREEFKEYELRKKAEEDHKLAQMPSKEREEEKHKIEEAQKRHNEHEKIKHPGGREQLEEVWEDTDGMDKDNFDPRTFFALHDLNGDGYWNDEEIESLFQIELAKLYNDTSPDDDPRERVEEMYRMREHVVAQMDKNKDRMISLDEFLQDTEATTDKKDDQGWNDLGNQKVYTDDELKRFEEEYAKQQNWGADAYAPVSVAPPGNAQPQAGQQQAAQPAHPAPVAQAPSPQEQQAHVNKVDPVYGV